MQRSGTRPAPVLAGGVRWHAPAGSSHHAGLSLGPPRRIAAAWAQLIARLGYGRYGAQGHDWGTSIAASIGQQDPGRVVGIHLVPPLVAPESARFRSFFRLVR